MSPTGKSILIALFASQLYALAQPVTHGPILGHVTSSSIRVWARTSTAGEFTVRYGLQSDRLDQRSAPVRTQFENDCAAWTEITGLKPNTRYYLQAVGGNQSSGIASSFRTLPDSKSLVTEHNPKGLFNVRFEFGSCANQNPEHGIGPSLPTYTTMLRNVRDKIQFAIMNGDWLYEEEREYPVAAWQKQVGLAEGAAIPHIPSVAPTIAGVWENYKLYLRRAQNLAEWHRRVPSYFTFDDHELVNDIWGTGTPGQRHRRTVFRDIGTEAWYDYLGWANPVAFNHDIHFGRAQFEAGSDLLVDPNADFTKLPLKEMSNLHVHWGTPTAGVNEMKYDDDSGDPNSRVYEIVEVLDRHTLRIFPGSKAKGTASYSIGRRSYGKFRVSNCEFFLLDTRSHRDMHDVRQRDKPGLSILGKHQTQWLIDSMRASDADFFYIVSSVPFTIPHIGAGGFEFDEQNKDESWTVFYDEREKLITFWETLKRPVFVLTGDLHNSFAIKITDRVWEFCSGPHNSVNHAPGADEGNRPASGKFQFGPRPIEIRWSSYMLADLPRLQRLYPFYCVVQVNNVFNNPVQLGGERWVAFPYPQVIFQYFDGRTGELQYAEAISNIPK